MNYSVYTTKKPSDTNTYKKTDSIEAFPWNIDQDFVIRIEFLPDSTSTNETTSWNWLQAMDIKLAVSIIFYNET